jgi:ferritin
MLKKSLLSSATRKLLNEAAGHELYASNLYKHVANTLQNMGLFGSQKFFLNESADELTHYQKIADFMNDRFDQVIVAEVPEMEEKIDSLLSAFELALETEMELGKFYSKFYSDCDCEVTKQFLLQFIEIQRLSVGEYGDFVATLTFVGDEKGGQLLFDQEING